MMDIKRIFLQECELFLLYSFSNNDIIKDADLYFDFSDFLFEILDGFLNFDERGIVRGCLVVFFDF